MRNVCTNTYNCEPLLLFRLSSSGIIKAGPVSGLGGLAGSGGGALNDGLRPTFGVTVLKAGTENTS